MTDKSGLKGNVDGHDGADEWRYGAEDSRVGPSDRLIIDLSAEVSTLAAPSLRSG